MKQKIALFIALALCIVMSVPTFATSVRKEGTLPNNGYAYEYVENCTVQIPGTETIFDLENVTAEVGTTTAECYDYDNNVSVNVPMYRFSFIGMTGKVTVHESYGVLNGEHYLAENEDGDIFDDGGYGDFSVVAGDTISIVENDGTGSKYWSFEIDLYDEFVDYRTVPIARVQFYMGTYFEKSYENDEEDISLDLIPDSWDTIDIETLMINNDVAPEYAITSGANAQWKSDSDKGLTITADGEFSKFTGVKVDDTLIDASNYTAKEGSTVVELKADYLKTLEFGKHEITIVYTDGEVSTDFTVKTVEQTNNNVSNNVDIPNTSASAKTIGSIAVLSAVSLLAIVLVAKKKK